MITQINNEQEYNEALDRMDELWHSLPGTPEGDELDALIILVDAYEQMSYATNQQEEFDFGSFDENEKTPEIPTDVNDLLNEWDKDIDSQGNVRKWNREEFCNCFQDNPFENWADGKKFFVCKNCGKEIY